MPEGDTIQRAARLIGAALVDREIVAVESPQPRHALERWPERLAGLRVRAVDARGKHLLLRFEGGVTLHSHLGMRGLWRVYRRGERWSRAPQRAWLVIRTPEQEVVQFDGPLLELMTDSRSRFDRRLAALGPDALAKRFDAPAFLRRLREDDQSRGVGDALLDQRNLAGVGNRWKSEGCFLAGVDPWRPLGRLSDDEALAIVEALRPRMREAAQGGGRDPLVYGQAGRPCPRCGEPIRARRQGDAGRTSFWCPCCQR